jgi:hypothetical protein
MIQSATEARKTKEWLDKQGESFHIRLLIYYNQYTSDEEQEKQQDTDVLFFDFPDGRYSITYLELKEKADEETIIFNEKNNIKTK